MSSDTPPPPGKPPWERFVVTLKFRDLEGGPPVPQRLKQLLKLLGRGFGFECVEVRPEKPQQGE